MILAADQCRQNGWGPGTTIRSESTEFGNLTLRITAIGEASILVRASLPSWSGEQQYRRIDHREWEQVGNE